MAILGVDTKCYILALFIRDDDERFLLGSGRYEFKDNQLHFAENAIQNDIVEVQGNDGYLLAGQVRRPGTQSFDGYVGDGTTEKTEVEEYRRKFFSFFRKNFFYKVVYVFPDGTAIQRKRGFLVDDPTVKELYQQYPEYHVALNFEDVNYYSYSENGSGEEIYAEEAVIQISTGAPSGGLIWDEYGAVSEAIQWIDPITISGKDIVIENSLGYAAPIDSVSLKGDAYQQTYSGKNLLPILYGSSTSQGITFTFDNDGTVLINGQNNNNSNSARYFYNNASAPLSFSAGTYYFIPPASTNIGYVMYDGSRYYDFDSANNYSVTFSSDMSIQQIYIQIKKGTTETFNNMKVYPMLSTLPNQTETDYEPYVGGIPSPNPDYPQEVQSVTGKQVVTITGSGGEVQEYEVNLQSKNLLDIDTLVAGYVSSNGTFSTAQNQAEMRSGFIKVQPNTTYTFSIQETADTYPSWFGVGLYSAASTSSFIRRDTNTTTTATSITFTTSATTNYVVVSARNMANATKAQLEEGSSATEYVAYSSIELCKIGDYQDYIYKSGDDWYLHKETSSLKLDSTLSWSYTSGARPRFFIDVPQIALEGVFTPAAPILTKSNYFRGSNWYAIYETRAEDNLISSHNSQHRICIRATRFNSVSELGNWLDSTGNVVAYYALDTPTDTQITDTTLISQLNALGVAKLYAGENNIAASSSTALNAEVEVGYYTGTADGAGYVWEEGTSGGPTTVYVDSITNIYPIWKVQGPVVNPQLSVLSTNTTLSYSGTVTASQTLIIDMFNKTAKLNGTSVIGNVSGDWVNFAPGNNRVVYTANNADAPSSLIQWQEVVG